MSLERIALLAVDEPTGLDLSAEIEVIEALGGATRVVERIEARSERLREAFASGSFDGFHVAAHGRSSTVADRGEILLAGGSRFTPVNLSGVARNLGRRNPLVFLNACGSGVSGWALTGIGGWAAHFLGVGCGAFLGTHWAVDNGSATRFARAFYRNLLDGNPIARAVRLARREIKEDGDPTWLAYVLHAYPGAVVASDPKPPYVASAWPRRRAEEPLVIPEVVWTEDHNPGSLLRAEYQVVPFHGRDREVEELYSWCLGSKPCRVRLCTGAGGMGKTRLALELCRILRDEGWLAGLLRGGSLKEESFDPVAVWHGLERSGQPLLIVVDYADTRSRHLVALLREALSSPGTKVRFLLLARAEGYWWEILKGEGEGVGDLLSGRNTRVAPLPPLAKSLEDRERSYGMASRAFADVLGRPRIDTHPEDLEAEHYSRVLLLHMSALATVQGRGQMGRDGILSFVLARERSFWKKRIDTHGLPPTFLRGLERAMAAITLVQGVTSQSQAVEILEQLRFFERNSRDLLIGAADVLRECYPGGEAHWIEPLRPDLVGEYLVMSESRDPRDRKELLQIAFGPQGPPS